MSITKRIIALLLSVMMVVTTFVVTTSAADGAANISMTVSATEVNIGDEVVVTIKSTAMTVSSFVCKLGFDNSMLTVAEISNPNLRYDEYDEEEGEDVEIRVYPTAISTPDEANGNGNVGATWAGTVDRDYKARTTLLKVTFTAKAAGSVTFTLTEDSDGADGYLGTAETATLTINGGGSTHTCTTLTHVLAVAATCKAGGNIEYWYCNDSACGKYYSDAAGTTEITDKTSVNTDKDPANHVTPVEFNYMYNDDTHAATYKCCQAPYVVNEPHKYDQDNGTKCICGKEKPVEHVCADTNFDHICDNGCDKVQGTHADGNDNDHLCDYGCGQQADDGHWGGTATCKDKATCTECGQSYGNMGDHNYGDLVQATEAVHTKNELKAPVAAHYQCSVCKKYFDENKVGTTLEALTGEAPQHAAQADDGDCTTDILCSCGKVMVEGNATHTGGTATCVAKAVCAECGQSYGELGNHAYGELKPAQEKIHSESTLQAPVAAHYQCSVCKKYFDENKVETTLAALTGEMPVHEHYHYYYTAEKHQSRCICGYNLMFNMEPHVDENADEKCDVCTCPMHTCANKLTYVPAATANCSKNGNIEYWECSCGKYYSDENATTEITDKTTVVTTAPNDHKYGDSATGWYQIGSDWYYGEYRVCDNNAAHVDHTPVTGIQRVPYPTVAINGVTYAPNAEDLAYYNAHKSSSKYSDADTAEFYFGEDGKFLADFTGIVGDSYVVNGIAPWHVGFVKIGEDYYYFAGDKTNGGNVMATGKVYATRANDTGKANGIYNFDTDGKLIGNYYGLYEYNGDIYYRRTSTGELATGWYYITVTNGIDGFKEGDKLFFGEDGKMADPKNGIVEEGGKLYYYVNNSIKGAGLIEIDGDYYYARTSTGEVVTGEYHITVTNGIEGFSAGQKCVFGTDGKLVK